MEERATESKYSPLLTSLDFWKGVELEKLDATAATITDGQETSLNERKKLAEETKKWNKLNQEEKIGSMISLLKSYQKEVDRLTTRAKYGESAFLEVYQSMSHLPDFEASTQLARELLDKSSQTLKLEATNAKLLREVEGYKADMQELQSQDVTVKRQESKIARYEQDLARLVSEGVLEAEKKIEASYQAEIDRREQIQGQLKSELKHANEQVSIALKDREITQTQLNNLESRMSREIHTKQSELDMMNSEIENLNQKVGHLQVENHRLKVSHATGNVDQEASPETADQEVDSEKDFQIAQMTQELHELGLRFEGMRQSHAIELTEYGSQLTACRATLVDLEAKVADSPSAAEWRETKERLALLQGLEYYLGASESEIGDATKSQGGVDVLIRDKLRKLERQNLELKSSLKALEIDSEAWNALKTELETQIYNKDSHIMKLESTLAQQSSTQQFDSSSPMFASSITKDAGGDNTVQNAQAMIEVLQAQRDRYKSKLEGLEADRDRLNEQLRAALSKAQSLEDDNVKLYQKIKYLQSYNSASVAQSSNATQLLSSKSHTAQATLTSHSHDLEQGHDVEDKYKSIYENSMNPFAAFSDREKTKRFGELNPAERIVLSATSFFLANKNTRMILFGYLVFLHLVVCFISYRSASVNSNCNQRAE